MIDYRIQQDYKDFKDSNYTNLELKHRLLIWLNLQQSGDHGCDIAAINREMDKLKAKNRKLGACAIAWIILALLVLFIFIGYMVRIGGYTMLGESSPGEIIYINSSDE